MSHRQIFTIGLFSAALLTASVAFSIEPNSTIQVTPILKTAKTWLGDDITYPSGKPEITGQIVEIAPGGETGWHSHPVPSFGLILEGELTVYFKNGETRHIKAGEAAAEAVNMLHNGRNTGKVPTKLVVFYAGEVGGKLTQKAE